MLLSLLTGEISRLCNENIATWSIGKIDGQGCHEREKSVASLVRNHQRNRVPETVSAFSVDALQADN